MEEGNWLGIFAPRVVLLRSQYNLYSFACRPIAASKLPSHGEGLSAVSDFPLSLFGLVIDATAGAATANEPVASIALNLWVATAFFGAVEAVRGTHANSGFAYSLIGKSSGIEFERVQFL